MSMTCLMVLLVALGTCFFLEVCIRCIRGGYVAVITIVGFPFDGEYRDVII